VEQQPRLLPRWDVDASAQLLESFCRAGIDVILGKKVDKRQISYQPGAPLQVEVGQTTLKPDLVLLATGRLPNVEELGLEALGIRARPFIAVDRHLRTSQPHIYAIGDVNGLSMFDSTALAQAQAAVDAICGKQADFDPRGIPQCIYTSPPMAAVGWMEAEAVEAGMDVIAGWETTGWIADEAIKMLDPYPTGIKVVLDAQTKRLLGCLAIGEQAVEVANICSILIKTDTPNGQLAGFHFAHPSAGEALQRCVSSVIEKHGSAEGVNSGGAKLQMVAREDESESLERHSHPF
jgi:pyruvate/2-oxoglutarate dehydrogenase complex dihydrolipoamide dehydrogenase (E3) component